MKIVPILAVTNALRDPKHIIFPFAIELSAGCHWEPLLLRQPEKADR